MNASGTIEQPILVNVNLFEMTRDKFVYHGIDIEIFVNGKNAMIIFTAPEFIKRIIKPNFVIVEHRLSSAHHIISIGLSS